MDNPLTKPDIVTNIANNWKNTLRNFVLNSQFVIISKLKRRRRYTLVLHRYKRNIVVAGLIFGFLVGLLFLALNNFFKGMSDSSTEYQESYSIDIPSHLFIGSIDLLEKWLRKELKLPYAKSHIMIRSSSIQSLNKIELMQLPELWEIKFMTHNSSFSIRYWRGDPNVLVIKREASFWGLLKSFHNGSTIGNVWALLVDSIAIGLSANVMISTLIWSRLNYLRLLAAGFIGITLSISFALVLNSLSLY